MGKKGGWWVRKKERKKRKKRERKSVDCVGKGTLISLRLNVGRDIEVGGGRTMTGNY